MEREKMIIVTGGAGFIGSCIVRHLNDRGYENLVIVDQLGDGFKWRNLVGKKFEALIHKDFFFDWLEGREEEIEAVVHMGACSSTTERDADYLLENNLHYTQSLYEVAMRYQWRFIYASSAATYGDGEEGFSDDHSLLESFKPMNMYGYSKHMFDLWLKKHKALDTAVGLKFFNVFGPNEWHKGNMASHIVKMVDQVRENEIRLFKSNDEKYVDGGQCRDFIYVKDVAKMTCSFLEPENRGLGGIFNVGLGIANTWNDLAQAVMDAMETQVPVNYIDMPTSLEKQYQNFTCADMEKWKSHQTLPLPSTDLKETVGDYVKNHLLKEEIW